MLLTFICILHLHFALLVVNVNRGNLSVSYIVYGFVIYLSILLIISSYTRMLVYEYVNNGNLEQWLHGAMRQHGVLTWEARMKIVLGIAKA